MKLYYIQGACSLSPHIALHELGLEHTAVKVDGQTKRADDGIDFAKLNPKGYVPVLVLDDGAVLTEGPAIVQYLADRKPGQIAPENGTFQRYKLQEWLNFISTELHKPFVPMFNPGASAEAKDAAWAMLGKRFELLGETLKKQPYLLGEKFTIADGYLFVVLSWSNFLKRDLSPWPFLQEYLGRIASRPAVQAALKAEGLLH